MTDPLVLAVVAPLGLAVLLVCLRDPLHVALPLFAALVPFGGLISIGHSRFSSLSSLVGIVLGLGLVLHLLRGRWSDVPLSLTTPLWLLFLGVAACTALWSVNPGKTVTSVMVLSSLVGVYLLISVSKIDKAVLTYTENGLLLGGVAVVLYGLFQLLVLGGFPADAPVGGIATDGRFGNDMLGPNNQAVALVLPLVIALSRMASRRERRSQLIYGVVAVLMLAGILMTGSRGGMLATGVAMLALTMANGAGRAKLLSLTLVGALLVLLVFVFKPLGITEREVETTSSSGRTDIWRVGLAACPQFCPVGAGWGTFPDVYAATQSSVPDAAVLVGKGGSYEPHNVWFLAAIELGVPGLLLLALVFVLTFVDAVRLPPSLRGPPVAAFVATIFAALFLSNLEFKFFWMAIILVSLARSLSLQVDRSELIRRPTPVERV
ncbi:MAG: O-antigen ligase family protein [Nocardioidaceae bacterium]